MRIRGRVLVAAMIAVFCQATLGDVVHYGLSDQRDSGFRSVVAIGPEYLGVAPLKRLLANGGSPSDRLCIISTLPDPVTAELMLYGKNHTEFTYSDWKTLYYAADRGRVRMARLVALGSDIVVQVADGGRVSRVVLSGSDPSRLAVGARTYELLEVYCGRWSHPFCRAASITSQMRVTPVRRQSMADLTFAATPTDDQSEDSGDENAPLRIVRPLQNYSSQPQSTLASESAVHSSRSRLANCCAWTRSLF